jgi:hypothetical protein
MNTREVYHGVNGDKMLLLLRTGHLIPDGQGRLFFAQSEYANTFMHGADVKRGGALAFKLRIQIPDGATTQNHTTPGVRDTIVLKTTKQVKFEVLEMYFRPRPTPGEPVDIDTYTGLAAIKQALEDLVAAATK